jgi:ATP-dependent helicase HrpA
VSEGVCIRLYTEESYASRPRFTDPEILRTNLASVILQMKALRLGEVQDFPFLEPPDYRAVRDGFATLHELGAIDADNRLTPLGAALARLPIDPRIGRMVLAAREEGVMDEVLIIASALAVQDPRERPIEKQEAADAAHAKFREETSDFLGFLKLWDWYHDNARHLSGSKVRKLCQENFISYVRMREWHDVHQQLHSLVTEMGLHHAARHPEAEREPEQAPRGRRRRRRSDAAPPRPRSSAAGKGGGSA